MKGKKRVKHKAAYVLWMLDSWFASVVVILFQTGEAYSNLDLTNVKYNYNKLPIAEKEKINVRTRSNILSDWGNTHSHDG